MNASDAVEHKVLKMSDYEIHYYKSGSKHDNLIILVHPAFSDHRSFDLQIEALSKNYCVITIDLIGHGLSKSLQSKDKIDKSSFHINEIIINEGFEKAHVLGVSMGSLIAQYFAFEYPEKVQSITILGGYNINQNSKDINKAQNWVNLQLFLTAIISIKAFRRKTAKMTCYTGKGQALFYESSSHFERKSFRVMQGLQHVMQERKIKSSIYPTLILTGEHDINLIKLKSIEWQQGLSNSSYFMIRNAGHCAHIDQAEPFNQLFLQFIENYNS